MDAGVVLEVVGRVVVIYALMLALLRLGGKRELAQLTPMDLLTMLLLSETVSPTLTGNRGSLAAGVIAATTLVGLSVLLGYLTFRSRRLERLVEGDVAVLIRDGQIDQRTMRRHRITPQALQTALHQSGYETAAEIRRAFVEPDGDISFLAAS